MQEIYTKIDEERLKVTTTDDNNGDPLVNEREETKTDLSNKLDDATSALDQAQGRMLEVQNLITSIRTKLAVFDQVNMGESVNKNVLNTP